MKDYIIMNKKAISFKNPRNGEIWICEDFKQKRKIDGVDFIEVHKPENTRMFWMNLSKLRRINKEK